MKNKVEKLKEDIFSLNEEDFNTLLEAIKNPPPPTKKLVEAMEKYKSGSSIVKVPMPSGNDYYSESSLDSYDFDKLGSYDRIVYWYGAASYEGNGQMLIKKGDLWYLNGLGHCSCYGPCETMSFNDGEKDPMAFLKKSSNDYKKDIEEICKVASSL